MSPSHTSVRKLLLLVVFAAVSLLAVSVASAAQTPVRNADLTAPTSAGGAKVLSRMKAPATPKRSRAGRASNLLFDGTEINDFGLQAAPGAISEVADPDGSDETVLKMTVGDDDVFPVTPTENPRAQALSPAIIDQGEEFWLQTKFMLPEDFPYVPGWMSLVSIYGPPFAGSSPWQIGVNESELRWQRDGAHGDDIPWRAPVVKGHWTTILMHERFDTDGFVEMWVDGERVTFFPDGNRNPNHEPQTDHLELETMDATNDGGPNSAKIMQYRMADMFQSASVYFGALKVGATRAAVEG